MSADFPGIYEQTTFIRWSVSADWSSSETVKAQIFYNRSGQKVDVC